MNFQQMILTLQQFWAAQNCILVQPYDTEKGAGTMNPMTFCGHSVRSPGRSLMSSLHAVRQTAVTGRTRTACTSITSSKSSSSRPRTIFRSCIWIA